MVRLTDGKRRLEFLRWGLIPSWAKDSKIGNNCINARGETVATAPAFRSAFKSRRCIVPADGYYEWLGEKGDKQPYHITLREPFAFAGLWETWKAKEAERNIEVGQTVETFAIVTTDAGEGTKAVHDREPVMLLKDQFEAWLKPDVEPDALKAMIRSVPAKFVEIRPVNRAVNNVRNDGPECLELVTA